LSGDSTSTTTTYGSATSTGGGIYNSGTVTVANSTLSGDSASATGVFTPFIPSPYSAGGGIYNGGNMTVTNSTLANDGALSGGDINSVTGGSTLNLKTTIVALGSGGDCSGTVTDGGYNIDDDGSCGFTLPSLGGYTTLSRTLGPLANNGGPTQTIALLPGSPAVDYVPAPDCPATDQRGFPRTPPCDIGAYDTDGNGPTAQTITFSSTVPSSATVGGPTYAVSATASSGLSVTLSIDSSASLVCSLSGSTVSFIGAGTCVIDANQAGNTNYSPASQVQQTFNVGPAPRAIISLDSATATVGKAFSFTVTTTGTPIPSITKKGTLPKHVTFVNNGNGTAIISGTPTKVKTFHFTIKATFGTGASKYVVSQVFTLTVT
jgi:hypothetical protein